MAQLNPSSSSLHYDYERYVEVTAWLQSRHNDGYKAQLAKLLLFLHEVNCAWIDQQLFHHGQVYDKEPDWKWAYFWQLPQTTCIDRKSRSEIRSMSYIYGSMTNPPMSNFHVCMCVADVIRLWVEFHFDLVHLAICVIQLECIMVSFRIEIQ